MRRKFYEYFILIICMKICVMYTLLKIKECILIVPNWKFVLRRDLIRLFISIRWSTGHRDASEYKPNLTMFRFRRSHADNLNENRGVLFSPVDAEATFFNLFSRPLLASTTISTKISNAIFRSNKTRHR